MSEIKRIFEESNTPEDGKFVLNTVLLDKNQPSREAMNILGPFKGRDFSKLSYSTRSLAVMMARHKLKMASFLGVKIRVTVDEIVE